MLPELPNLVTLTENFFHHARWAHYLAPWENVIFSLFIIIFLSIVAYCASRRPTPVPGRLQNVVEVFVDGIDNFVCGILGPKGRKHVPFIGTLFIYILCMDLEGLIPFLKSSTSSLSTTVGLAICVFVYVHYSAIRELGFFGYLDSLAERPRGALAFSIILPIFMFFMNVISQLIRPVSLALRLRSNIMADDMLLASLTGFGLKGLPLLFLCTFIVIIAALVQAVVFSLLSTIYLALFLTHEESSTHTAS